MEVSARSALSAYNAYKDLKIGTGLFDSMSMSYIIIGLISFPTFVLLQWGTQLLICFFLWGHVTLSYSFLVGGVLIMFPSVSIRICAAQQCPADHFTQVDPTGTDAWIAGETASSLDGHSNAGGTDIFLMKFQVTGLKVERRVVGAHRSTEVGTIGSASSGVARNSSKWKKCQFLSGLEDVWGILESIPHTMLPFSLFILKTCERFIRIPHSHNYIYAYRIPHVTHRYSTKTKGR